MSVFLVGSLRRRPSVLWRASGELTNITVQKLPPNTTSYLQPMDAGIIAAAKSGYRDRHMSLACNRADKSMPHKAPEGKGIYYVDQLQGMKWVDEAWGDITPEKIRHCFMKSGIVFSEEKENNTPPTRRHQVRMSDVLI